MANWSRLELAVMTKQQALNCVLSVLAKVLSDSGFVLNRAKGRLLRQVPGGVQVVGVPCYDYAPEFEFSFTFCSRIEDAERLYHLFSGTAPKYQDESFTTITQMEYFSPSASFKVTTEQDVADAISRLGAVFRDKVIPFFDEHREISQLSWGMNKSEKPLDTSNHPARAMHGVIIAHLAKEPEFGHVVNKYREEMRSLPNLPNANRGRENFEKLVQHLSGLQAQNNGG